MAEIHTARKYGFPLKACGNDRSIKVVIPAKAGIHTDHDEGKTNLLSHK